MSEQTKIQWCDSTVNFWSGCTKVSAGCANCYAEERDKRQLQEPVSHWGPNAKRLKHSGAVRAALAFNKKPWICDGCRMAAENAPLCHCSAKQREKNEIVTIHRRRIFSLSLGDWLDDEVPIEWLAEMLDTIRQCDQVIWILCTKRPENWPTQMLNLRQFFMDDSKKKNFNGEIINFWLDWIEGNPPKNIILLTSVENQATADARIPELLKIPAACRGLSLEPLLASVTLDSFLGWSGKESGLPSPLSSALESLNDIPSALDWLIIGGESGSNARPCNMDWIRSLVQQGKEAGVATFVKQLGACPTIDEETPDGWPVGTVIDNNCVNVVKLRDKKGGDIAEWPVDLSVQQWPEGF